MFGTEQMLKTIFDQSSDFSEMVSSQLNETFIIGRLAIPY
jgi:hypothetical protein